MHYAYTITRTKDITEYMQIFKAFQIRAIIMVKTPKILFREPAMQSHMMHLEAFQRMTVISA